jgi:uncharacterized protein DUF4375
MLMVHAPEQGHLYSSVVEPYWDSLNESWDAGVDKFLSQMKHTPERARHLYAAHWCQSEVCNGGLYQFFYNTTGILAPEAAEGFEAIGFSELTTVVLEAMRYFGPVYPRERSPRLELLPVDARRKRQEWDPFIALDERFYDCIDSEKNFWERMADSYASGA